MVHAYPHELARFVHDNLPAGATDLAELEIILSAAYQASLLREEERNLSFRLLLTPPDALRPADGPPQGLHRLRFEEPRRLNEQEIRRLAPAAKMQRAMIGVAAGVDGLHIWGLVQTGPAWIHAIEGGRAPAGPMPDALSVVVTGPGRVLVSHGGVTIAKLSGGEVSGASPDVFDSKWLPDACAENRREVFAAHESGRTSVPPIDTELLRKIDQQLVRRILANVRLARHGGTILLLPQEDAGRVVSTGRPIKLKYRFIDEEPRRRYRSLQLRLLEILARNAERDGATATWERYVESTDPDLGAIDAALLELAHTIAGLASVDGAVVLSKRFDVMGFGGEIGGDLADVPAVMRALDLEGDRREPESTDGVGTRHRSVYRLCAAIPDALGIVVSQDGGVRLVATKDGAVTYWDQLGTGPMEI